MCNCHSHDFLPGPAQREPGSCKFFHPINTSLTGKLLICRIPSIQFMEFFVKFTSTHDTIYVILSFHVL